MRSAPQEPDRDASGVAVPSWADEPPPATRQLLPPIRSASNPRLPVVVGARPAPPARPLSAAASLARTVLAERERPAHDFTPPLIIPGNGVATAPPVRAGLASRSHLTHLAIFAIAFCLALSALYITAPLTVGATGPAGVFGGAMRAVDNPAPTAIPTAIPVVAATGGAGGGTAANPGASAIIAQIRAVFGPYADGAIAIARCESGFNPNAWNATPILGSHASGVFQILYPITWLATSQAGRSPYDAAANIQAAHELFARDGYTWREWACQP